MLSLCKYALLWRSDEDLRDSVKNQEEERFEGGEGVTEVHQGGDEDEEVEDKGSDIA